MDGSIFLAFGLGYSSALLTFVIIYLIVLNLSYRSKSE